MSHSRGSGLFGAGASADDGVELPEKGRKASAEQANQGLKSFKAASNAVRAAISLDKSAKLGLKQARKQSFLAQVTQFSNRSSSGHVSCEDSADPVSSGKGTSCYWWGGAAKCYHPQSTRKFPPADTELNAGWARRAV